MQPEGRSFMKRFTALLVGLLVIAISLVGCSKKSSVDTSKLESSFKSAEPATQSDVDKAVSSIKAGNYSDAMAQLQTVAKKAKLTPEQQQAIKDTIASIQKQMAEMANQAAGSAQKATSDLQKSLPK
jgi:outer membrane protein assembly factor BamD (BamD/ComL family)